MNHSNTFSHNFFEHLLSFETNNRFSLSELFSNTFRHDYALCDTLPSLYCSKRTSVSTPFFYEVTQLDAYCMLYTTKGTGQLLLGDDCYELTADTFVFFDCRLHHKLTCLHNIWEFSICFVSTPITAFYYNTISHAHSCCFHLNHYTDLLTYWEPLLRDNIDDEAHAMLRARTLISLYTELYLLVAKENSGAYHIPTYLLDMKKGFDSEYRKAFSLDELAQHYQISKYRLCREFSRYYQDTPLQYLNHVRIERAKELLLTTDEKIGVIGQLVGIDNTNHFIRLFKEKTGVTPLRFRRDTPVLTKSL